MKYNNIQIIGIPEGEEKEQGIETLFEKNSDRKLLKPGEWESHGVQEPQRVPNKINPKRPTTRYIMIKMAKFKHKEKILKTAKEKQEATY